MSFHGPAIFAILRTDGGGAYTVAAPRDGRLRLLQLDSGCGGCVGVESSKDVEAAERPVRHGSTAVASLLGHLDPALTTLSFLGGTIATAALLRVVTQFGDGTDQQLADSAPFGAWIVVASLAVVLFMETAVAGVHEVLHRDQTLTTRTTGRYARWYVAFAGLAVAALLLVGKGGPSVAVDAWPTIARSLLVLGAIAAGPWIVLVWSSHDLLAKERTLLATKSNEARSADTDEALRAELDARLTVLLSVRQLIAKAVYRLVGLVLAAVLVSGALRAALIPRFLADTQFPASAVVTYGAFFAVLLSLAVLPLMFAWRRTATTLLNSAYPLSVATPAERAEARSRLAAVLDIDGSLFRSPIAISSILAPLVTSLLAAFIPQLGK